MKPRNPVIASLSRIGQSGAGAHSSVKRHQNLQLAELAEQLQGLEPQEELESFRVWPCGTVQSIEEGDPYSHLSDDFLVIQAPSEEDALRLAAKI